MTTLQTTAPFPQAIADAVREAIGTTFSSILGQKPTPCEAVAGDTPLDCVIGAIAYVGDVTWTMALVLPQSTAPALVLKFAGFEIPFDSADMGDVVGELANVLAGDVRARLEGKKIKSQMSLPSVTRGKDVELLPAQGQSTLRLTYRTAMGDFRCELVTGQPWHLAPMPGK